MKNIYVNVIQMYDDACAFVSVMAKNLLTDLFPDGPAHHLFSLPLEVRTLFILIKTIVSKHQELLE